MTNRIIKYQTPTTPINIPWQALSADEKKWGAENFKAANNANLNTYLGKTLTPEQLKAGNFTTNYSGKFRPSGNSDMSSFSWEAMRRNDPNQIITGDAFNFKTKPNTLALNSTTLNDNNLNGVQAAYYKELYDDNNNLLYVPQYGIEKEPEIFGVHETGQYPDGASPDPTKGWWYKNASGQQVPVNEKRFKYYNRSNIAAQARHDAKVKAYQDKITALRAAGVFDNNNPAPAPAPIKIIKKGGILYGNKITKYQNPSDSLTIPDSVFKKMKKSSLARARLMREALESSELRTKTEKEAEKAERIEKWNREQAAQKKALIKFKADIDKKKSDAASKNKD
jgi:hypothetical protein